MGWIASLIGGIGNLVTDWLNGQQEEQKAKHELKMAKLQAKTQHVYLMDKTRAAWNIKAMENAGWRDEYLTIVLSIPLIAAFVPPLVPYVQQGFEALGQTPEWYRIAISAMIGSAYGYKKLTNWMIRKQGIKGEKL